MNFELRHPQPPAPLLPASQSCDLNGKGADSTAVQVCLRLSFRIVSKQFRLARSAVAKAWLRLQRIHGSIPRMNVICLAVNRRVPTEQKGSSPCSRMVFIFMSSRIIVLFPLHQKSRTSDNSDKARLPSSDERCHR